MALAIGDRAPVGTVYIAPSELRASRGPSVSYVRLRVEQVCHRHRRRRRNLRPLGVESPSCNARRVRASRNGRTKRACARGVSSSNSSSSISSIIIIFASDLGCARYVNRRNVEKSRARYRWVERKREREPSLDIARRVAAERGERGRRVRARTDGGPVILNGRRGRFLGY